MDKAAEEGFVVIDDTVAATQIYVEIFPLFLWYMMMLLLQMADKGV